MAADVIGAIREQSIDRNQATGLTGLLLWTSEHFCQILQGQKYAVEETMRRISRDTRHVDPIVLLRTDLAEALFPDWSMATSHIDDPSVVGQIAIAYQDRLADLSVVDGIISLMQQFQLNNKFQTPAVHARSALDQQLATLAMGDISDQAIEQVLQLGTSVFDGCAVFLLLRAAVVGDFYVKASAGIEGSDATDLIDLLPLDQVIPDCQAPDCNAPANQAPVVGTDKTSDAASAEVMGKPVSVTLPNGAAYQCATGCEIRAGNLPSLLSVGTTGGTREVDPANSSVVVGSLWVLSDTAKTGVLTSAKSIDLRRIVTCLENLLEQRFQSHASELLRQKSRRQQLSLAASNRRQEMVMNVASSAIVALDRDCRVLIINDAARQMFGRIADLIPFHWPDEIVFLSPWSLEPLPDSSCPIHLAATNAGTGTTANSFHATYTSNNIVALQINESEPLRYLKVASSGTNESDSAISGVVVFDDITELQHNRERIRRSDRLEALGHLTGGIAHDFNNLLSTIQSSVELATIETSGKSRQTFLDVALDSVQRGADLTDKLVAFAVARPVSPQAHQLHDVMQSVADLVTASIEQDIKFLLDDVPQSLAVYCDGGQLENALLNILINSRDAILESGTGDRVSITVKSTNADCIAKLKHAAISADQSVGQKVLIVVEDNGPGMSAEVIRRATDPFFTTRAGRSGSGLGLSMVYRFVEQSEGEMLIENLSDTGLGTTGVRVTLLLEQASIQTKAPEVPLHVKTEPTQNNATILLVEDEPDLAAMLRQSLHRFGLVTRVAHSADAALMELQTGNDIDLLLTDIIMPGSELDGYSLAAEAIRLKPGLKVVYLSGYPQQSGKKPATTFGPLIKKPVSMKKLATVIQKQLGHNAVADSEPRLVPG